MSATVNSKRLWVVPERPLSADPTPPSSSRPFSSFSSSISAMFSGRHSRSTSTSVSGQNAAAHAPARPASAAPPPQAKWVPRPVTPGSANQPRTSRHRSTSSASAAAAALALATSIDAPLPPLPVGASQHRSSHAPHGEGVNPAAGDAWKVNVQRRLFMKYRNRMLALERTFATRGSNAQSRRRDSLSSGSSASTGTDNSDTQSWEEILPQMSREEILLKLRDEYEKEMRSEILQEASRLGVSPDPMPSVPSLFATVPHQSKGHMRDVLVEDEPADEWIWRPDANGRRQSDDARKEKWRERVRQDQQLILESIKFGHAPASERQQQPMLSTSASRKVHFAPPSSDFAASRNATPPSATPLSTSQTLPPSLPRTPFTAGAPVHPARSISAHPSVLSSSANRPVSPAVAASGVRPGSARSSSPAYARWLPSTGPQTSTSSVHVPGHGHKTGSKPISIPRRNSGTAGIGEGNGSSGGDKATGSWRDWTSSTHGQGYLSGSRRDSPTPSPTTGNGVSHAYAYTQHHARTASNGNLHSSASTYAGAQMHHRTPSSGNLQTSHNRVPSNGNMHGGINRRAVTPGPMSSASAYARQRTTSVTQRAPSVPPIAPNLTRDKTHDREFAYGKEYVSWQDKARAKNGVVDDRDPDGERTSTNPVRRVQATAGLGSRTSSNRSALVDEDAPAPEAFASSPAPIMRVSSSREHHSTSSSQDDDEEEQIPKRDKGKGKARAPPSPVFSQKSLPRTGRDGIGGLYVAQLEDFATTLRRDLGISTEA